MTADIFFLFFFFLSPSEFSCHMPSMNASGRIEWSRDLDSLRLQVDH